MTLHFRCVKCGGKLSREEVHYYRNRCERCEQSAHADLVLAKRAGTDADFGRALAEFASVTPAASKARAN